MIYIQSFRFFSSFHLSHFLHLSKNIALFCIEHTYTYILEPLKQENTGTTNFWLIIICLYIYFHNTWAQKLR